MAITYRAAKRAWLVWGWLLTTHASAAVPTLRYEVIARYPHPDSAFTQGLEIDGNTVFESSGLYDRSYIVAWPLASQTPVHKQTLSSSVFGEGLTLWGERIYVLTWREQRGFIFDKNTLKKLGEFSYSGEGWGLTHTDRTLIMSDGSASLRVIDPQTLRVENTIDITEDGKSIDNLNELEWIPAHNNQAARLLANLWQSDAIVVIDAGSGRVTARIDLSKLYPQTIRSSRADVLNGIALDARDQTLLVTGKFWPYVYRIRILDVLP